ncbi:hypothetical protein Pint_02624 [Pistacia integerrima]|uniref:Uncharacterized protein n=1 Tax=Pistacia integerrima TaxID=434235 RepID=A0ACC0ZJI2_9ROSI|nr:hypothetical protein Pint_02624 [Pistacia integerrima]
MQTGEFESERDEFECSCAPVCGT